MNETLPQHDIVLLGAGHTNAHIIRMWRMNPIPRTRLTCVSDHNVATYSGMLAGTLAGQYEPADMTIDLVRLCASCGVRLIHARATGLDLESRRLLVEDRHPVRFDLLSIGIGSRPTIPAPCSHGLSIKPMQAFLPRLRQAIEKRLAGTDQKLQIAIVGGGAAGVEIACCLQEFVNRNFGNVEAQQFTLLDAHSELLAGMPSRTQELAARELAKRGIQVKSDSRVVSVEDDAILRSESGETLSADITIWATSAQPAPLLSELGLPLDERGFLATHDTLQSTGAENVFAVGDAGSVETESYAKAGVYAVRQGPVLWNNLRRKLSGRQLEHWKPQKKFLSLIGTGDERAILTYHGLSLHNRWCWKLKDWIDSRFMAKYQQYEPPAIMGNAEDSPEESRTAMQCGGCGSKASASVLRDTLPSLIQPHRERVLMGLDSPDDIALIANSTSVATAVSTDFFSAFVDEPYLLGRIAAQNALSDLFAKSARPRAALSMAILPSGSEKQQSNLLEALLAGALREFEQADVSLVGGHSIVGPKLTIGFTILGDANPAEVARKSTVAPGDRLVLTKPLGTGVLLAAHMQAACRAEWWGPLVESMLASNQQAAAIARQYGVSAATDVTGFGLAGHLREMIAPAALASELSLSSLPILPGAGELLENGFASTLAPSNREAVCDVMQVSESLSDVATSVLFDPQTSGGLLVAVPDNQVDGLLNALDNKAWVIGRIVDSDKQRAEIRVLP